MAVAMTSITTSWTPPDLPEGISGTAHPEQSRFELTWDPSTLSTSEFGSYKVYRRELGSGSRRWTLLSVQTSKSNNSYSDIMLGHGIQYEYMVKQVRKITGDEDIESEASDILTGILDIDDWFVIGNKDWENPAGVFILPVIRETHQRFVQQEIFEPVTGYRKRVVRGNVLGMEGSMTLMWPFDTQKEGQRNLNFLVNDTGPHILKSPFGDVWLVEFDAPDYMYSPVGHLTTNIGWVEID